MNAALVAATNHSPPSLDSGAARVRQLPQQSGGTDFFAFMANAQSLAQQQLSQRVDDAGPMTGQAPAELLTGQPEAVRQEPDTWSAGVSSPTAEVKPPETRAEEPEAESAEMPAVPVEQRAVDKPKQETAAGEKEQADAAQAVVSEKAEKQRSDKTRGDETARSAKEAGQEVARRELAGEGRERLAQLTQELKREASRVKVKRAGAELGQDADREAVAVQQAHKLADAAQKAGGNTVTRVDRIQQVLPTAASATPVMAAAKPVISPVKTQVRPETSRTAVGDPAAAPINAFAPATVPAHQAATVAARKSAAIPPASTSVGLGRDQKPAAQPVAVFAAAKTPARQLYRAAEEQAANREGGAGSERQKTGPRLTLIDRRTNVAPADVPAAAMPARPEAVRPAAWAPILAVPAAQNAETRAAAKVAGREGPRVEATTKATAGDAAGPTADSARNTATVTAKAVTAPAPVNRAEMAQQLQDLVREARFTLTDNKTEVSMQLKPESLGRVKLQMAIEGDVVNGRLITETVAAKDALEEHLPEMLKQFETQGLTVGAFSVEVRQQPQPAQQPDADGGNGGGGRQDARETTEPGADDPGPRWYRHSDSRVEYIV